MNETAPKEPLLPFETIRVGYQDVKIKNVNTSNGDFGRYHGGHGIMHVDTERHGNKRELANTVLHEIVHAVFRNQGLGEVEPKHRTEELVVYAITNGLTQVFLDNPVFYKWLGESIADSK